MVLSITFETDTHFDVFRFDYVTFFVAIEALGFLTIRCFLWTSDDWFQAGVLAINYYDVGFFHHFGEHLELHFVCFEGSDVVRKEVGDCLELTFFYHVFGLSVDKQQCYLIS